MRRRAMLHTRLDYPIVTARGFDHGAPLFDIVRERLFDIDVLASLAGHHHRNCMPMIGRGDMNCIDLFQFEQLPEVIERPS